MWRSWPPLPLISAVERSSHQIPSSAATNIGPATSQPTGISFCGPGGVLCGQDVEHAAEILLLVLLVTRARLTRLADRVEVALQLKLVEREWHVWRGETGHIECRRGLPGLVVEQACLVCDVPARC